MRACDVQCAVRGVNARRSRIVMSVAVLALFVGCRTARESVQQPAPVPAAAPVTAGRAPVLAPATLSLASHRIVPVPVTVVARDGAPFVLSTTTSIVVQGSASVDAIEATRIAEGMASVLRRSTGFRTPVVAAIGTQPPVAAAQGSIVLRLAPSPSLGSEGYEIDISTALVEITAATPAGLFHGVQTLRQLLPVEVEGEQSVTRLNMAFRVPLGHITDTPRYSWRGAMLDVARHFFTVDEVRQYIDMLALYKINTLHLHLSDDQGWRVHIDAWPKLTSIGGSTEVGARASGFYTKRDYGEIVGYARERFITVVPEIDMPGHTNAAIASYPELGCSRATPGLFGGTQPAGVYTGIRVGWSTLCSDSATTYRFVEDVVRELAAMTPGPYLHIGGDEVEALTPEQYARFVGRVQDIVYQYGKTMVGWEEVGKAQLRSTSIAQLWRSDTALLAVRQGARLIMSPASRAYLDMKYTATTELGLRWAGLVSVRTAYDWDPGSFISGLTDASIVGIEAPLWTETVQNLTAAQYLVLPRLPALAEVGWSPQSARGWESFRIRLAAHAPRWRLLGMNFYPSPEVPWDP